MAAYEHEWKRRLETLCEHAIRDAVVNLRVLRGRAAGTLIAAARDSGADLILIGSRGAGRVRGALLGSVSSQVLTHAPCSVMLFNVAEPSTPAARARSVVVGIDGSPSSLYALEIAEALAVPLGAKLVLVHAYDPHIPLAVMTTEGIRELLRNHGHEVLVAAREALNEPLDVHEQVVEARARDALIAACEQHTPALAVVGSRGLHGFQELLVGSTSRYLADHAPCPVLVARRPPQRSDSR